MKKITVYTNHFKPEQFKINDLVKRLSRKYEIEVITQIPNYPKGKYYDGFGVFKKKKEVCDKVTIKRLFVIPRGRSKIGLVLNYLSYIISSFFYSLYRKRVESDLIFIYITSPIFIAWAAIRHGKKQDLPLIMYLLDLWPDNLFSIIPIRSRAIKKVFEKMCIKIYMRMDVILISSLSFKEVLLTYGVAEDKIVYFPQHEKLSDNNLTHNNVDKLSLLFAGNIGEAQGLDLLIDISKELNKKEIKDVKFNIVGDGRYKSKFIQNVSDNNVMNYFEFFPSVKKEDLDEYYQKNDFGLVILRDDETINRHLPAKVQGYMANGIPILAFATDETKRIIQLSNSGICIESTDPLEISESIIQLMGMNKDEFAKYGENGYQYAKKNFDIAELCNELDEIIKNLSI